MWKSFGGHKDGYIYKVEHIFQFFYVLRDRMEWQLYVSSLNLKHEKFKDAKYHVTGI